MKYAEVLSAPVMDYDGSDRRPALEVEIQTSEIVRWPEEPVRFSIPEPPPQTETLPGDWGDPDAWAAAPDGG